MSDAKFKKVMRIVDVTFKIIMTCAILLMSAYMASYKQFTQAGALIVAAIMSAYSIRRSK